MMWTFARFILLFGPLALFPSFVSAEPIERPAGDIGLSKKNGFVLPSRESSKSKLVPIKRVMNVANAKPQSAGRLKIANSEESAAPDASGENVVNDAPADNWDSASKRFDQQDPANTVTKGVRVEDIIEPTAEYRYVSGRRKNPFVPDVIKGRSIKQKELDPNDVEIPIINPLQSFDVKQLSVIGTWESSESGWKALIQTPSNTGIETKLGDPAGNSGGRIVSISPEAVIVREFSVRADGTREYRDVPLYMGSDKQRTDDGQIGGRVILRPGASTPEIEGPDSQKKSLTPILKPSTNPGALSTIVPGASTLPLNSQYLRGPQNIESVPGFGKIPAPGSLSNPGVQPAEGTAPVFDLTPQGGLP